MTRSTGPLPSLSRQLQRRVLVLGSTAILGFSLALLLGVQGKLQSLEADLETASREAALGFDNVLGGIRLDLEASAGALASSEPDDHGLRSLFRRTLDRQAAVLSVTQVSPAGEVLEQRRRVFQEPEKRIEPAPWIEELRLGRSHVGAVELEDVDDVSVPFVNLVVPVLAEDGGLLSALVARVDLSSLWSDVTSRKVGEEGYVLIVQEDGQLLVYRDLRRVREGERIDLEAGRTWFDLRFREGLVGSRVVSTSVRLNAVPWFAVVEQPLGEALAPLVPATAFLVLLVLLALFLVYGISRFLRSHLVSPLAVLREGVEILGSGRLEHRIEVGSEDELGTLAAAFNNLADQLRRTVERLRRRQEALREAHDQLERRVDERTADLEAANQEMRNLVYLVSHDLRAPLINLKGFASELRAASEEVGSYLSAAPSADEPAARERIERFLEEDVLESLSFIDSAASRMDSVTIALLKLSRAGHREMVPSEVDMEALVQEILQALAYQVQQQDVEVEIGELPVVKADRLALEQVVGNLVHNAITYLDPERPGRLKITAESGEKETVFRFEDNGRGIPEDNLARIFEPFRRLDQSAAPGEGMGLAYAQALVRRHRGRIWCQSAVGAGSEFAFSIPKALSFED